ncbi:hypothetical protein N431DRAFT_419464 [Stipitochalara longipes BDJ]|nr:hypothetical protein N431DRAFT_419464 [Stipitochalara longipes BDJ]
MMDDQAQYLPVQLDPTSSVDLDKSEKLSSYACNVCNQTYTRIDHLSRHYRSHTREKPFSCSKCGKSFGRTDLLKRHAESHNSGKSPRRQQLSQTQRVAQACSACASAKLRCGNDKPCRRCQQKGIPCVPPPSHGKGGFGTRRTQLAENMDSKMIQTLNVPTTSSESQVDQYAELQQQPFPMLPGTSDFSSTPGSFTESAGRPSSAGFTIPDEDPMIGIDDSSLAEFLQDIMTRGSPNYSKDNPSMDMIPQDSSWDVLNFGIDSSLDFNDMDLGWITSHNQTSAFNYNMLSDLNDPPLDQGQETPDVQPSISLGAEAFRKSLWTWLPGQLEHAFMEVSNLSLTSKDMEGLESRGSPDIIDHQLEQSSRDDILAMVLSMNSQHSGISRVITSFPSTQLLNRLMHLFLKSEATKMHSWIHLPTFRPRTQGPEFNGIVIASGAILSAVPTVRKLGLAIQETVRLALPSSIEKDNSRSRELQLLQAYALELNIGLWSGNKRKMEIAEAHAQPLITMLRRAGRYRRSKVLPAAPEAGDDSRTLEIKWRAWVEVESFKRLAFHTLLHDAQTSISLLVRPLISYTEVSLELPCAPSLWRAKSAQAWRTAYLQNPDHSNRLPSLMNCVHDLHPLSKFQNVIDVQYSSSIILHAIWSLIAEYRSLEFVLKLQNQERHWNGGLISSSWHQELSQLLEHFSITVNECPGGIRLEQTMIKELFMMNLHVSFEELQLFAGKEGNEEAQRVYPLLKTWFENRKSRQAVWHAGQVIRAALAFPPNQLRDFYAVALYHASLAVWVYGMVSLGSSRSRMRKAGHIDINTGIENEIVYLDGEDTSEARRFIAISRGIPAIHEPPLQSGERQGRLGYARLDNPKAVMEVVIGILMRNCTVGNAGLAPLIENLAQLVRDLGNAARIIR